MKRRTLLAAATTGLAAALPARARAEERTKVVFWHAMTAALGAEVDRLVTAFNASQAEVEVTALYKGSYADVMTATIAAFRAGQAPHVAQIFEVGTGTMLAAGRAVKQVWELAQETGVAIKPEDYIGAVRGYYSLPDGRMASAPFNSSTAIAWYNMDAFDRAGLDPHAFPQTWADLVVAARWLKKMIDADKNKADDDKTKLGVEVSVTTSWPCWIQLEQYSALHNIPFATKANGFEGLDAELAINSAPHVKHVQRLLDMAKEGTFRYAGRGNAPDPLLLSGKAAIAFNSSGMRGDLVKSAKFAWAPAYLPYDPEIIPSPLNSIIGGASLWPMTAPNRTAAEYKGVALFLQFLATPENAAAWHQHTGYVPVTLAGFVLSEKQGFYTANPGADLPARQLTRGAVTENSKGLRLGRLPEIRNIIEEEIEKALQGAQTAQQAMGTAVERGNKVLRDFQRSVKA